ncbi:hypothetical protein [Methylobacterium sp. NEAU K]|uniref:hypothetical protein n=1 Tax=Methylobacterium sp. NEAU K TaxID=3064946 RepID=UPI0027364BB4|nr:hypothetical protein [Methylobacterium sp. NEAU K]MDP4006470.1 hypothetical protein [Methylobacterium sp. NEAU K]
MHATERRVLFFDLVIKKLGKSTHVPPLADLLSVWQEHKDADKAFHYRQRGDVLYQINDMHIDEDSASATMLISVIDRRMADVAYGDLDTRKTKILKKADREGNNHSAHMVMSLKPHKADTYLCMLESVSRVGAAHIQYLLNHLMRNEYKVKESRFSFPHPGGVRERNGQPKRINFLPLIRLGGHPSPSLIKDIENGRIRHVSLIEGREKTPFGDDPYLVEETYQLTLGVKQDIPAEGRWERLKGVFASHRGDYTEGRISFVDPHNSPKTVEFDLDNMNLDAVQYIKYTILSDINPPLAYASERIVPHMEERMLSILIGERGE